MGLTQELALLDEQIEESPWPGYEHYQGYGVMVLPFTSGHLLGLRVFPKTDLAPYRSVWHCSPGGEWSIFNDGHSLNTTCPRWWGPALTRAEMTEVRVNYVGSRELQVQMNEPALEWSIVMEAPLLLRIYNALAPITPLWIWRHSPLLKVQEWAAKQVMGMGSLRFSFRTPAEQQAYIFPEQIYFIRSSWAIFEGEDLGDIAVLPDNPTIGQVPLPKRPTFMIGQAYARLTDYEGYRRTRQEIASKRE